MPRILPLFAGVCACLPLLLSAADPAAPPGSPLPAITRPHRHATLSPTAPGRIERILVEEGSVVTKGQALIELDRTQEELEVKRRKSKPPRRGSKHSNGTWRPPAVSTRVPRR